ncbi:unnamed protein product, partial [Didymodactylos carnosus]
CAKVQGAIRQVKMELKALLGDNQKTQKEKDDLYDKLVDELEDLSNLLGRLQQFS